MGLDLTSVQEHKYHQQNLHARIIKTEVLVISFLTPDLLKIYRVVP